MLRARESFLPERFSFHSSRMRLMKVTKEELAAAVCTTHQMRKVLGPWTGAPNAGALLSGRY